MTLAEDLHRSRAELLRPLPLGASIGHPLGTAGALGLFVTLPNGRRGLLSTVDVLAPKGARSGDYIHQPSPLERLLTGETRVARLAAATHEASPPSAGWLRAAELLDEVETDGNLVPGPMGPTPVPRVLSLLELAPGTPLILLARGGEPRPAHLVAIESKYEDFSGCAMITGPQPGLTRPGDGGALVYRASDGAAVGLVVAAEDLADGGLTLVAPLEPAMTALEVVLPT